jgi:predicted nuclease of restriction endonuclease-like (RecB) superfamily
MMKNNKLSLISNDDDIAFYKQVSDLLVAARKHAKRQMDNTVAVTRFLVGYMIVEREQQGQKRAKYGSQLMKGLSDYLTEHLGGGFSITNLKYMRTFYTVFASSKGQMLSDLFEECNNLFDIFNLNTKKSQMLSDLFKLDWSQYQILMRVTDESARNFYEIETETQQWTYKQLQRQVGTSLYERLALSRDKDEVMKLSNKGQVVENPRDIFKTPYIFEFTGLDEKNHYSETDLEVALIDNMQKFLLELGKGFLYEARQKRFTFDEDSFYLDLVLYNRLLQCYVIIDLKIGKLKHQDLGQMQMYVNYFDRYVKRDFEKPTVGILICEDRKDKIVEMTLPKDSNIYASEYSLYLPDKDTLQSKLAEWIEEFEENQEMHKLINGGDGE